LLRRTLLAMLAASRVALSAAADETVWRDYLEWYRAQPVNGPDTLKAYLDHLVKSGVGDPERNRRAGILERLIRERREELHTAFFDRTYAGAPRFNTAPNRLLAETVKGLRPGRALDVHMGQGRNALFLAAQGWDVTGFDYSAEGVRAARKAAEKAGLRLQAIVARHETFDFGQSKWDMVVMSYSWVPLTPEYAAKICLLTTCHLYTNHI
jgi:SAM-dependent methyltransferase